MSDDLGPAPRIIRDVELHFDEAQETLSAIRNGEVAGLGVATGGEGSQAFLLEGADRAHRSLFETLNEGARTSGADATILRANRRPAGLVGEPLERVLGARLTRF